MEEKHQFSLDAATPLQAITTPHKLHQDSARVGNKQGGGSVGWGKERGEKRRGGEDKGEEGRQEQRLKLY